MIATLSEEQQERFIRDGYLIARKLLPQNVVATTREGLLAVLKIDAHDLETWKGKGITADPAVLAVTAPCRTEADERMAEQLVGPNFIRGECYSPYLESQGASPALAGYIPVLNFPSPGPPEYQKPLYYH